MQSDWQQMVALGLVSLAALSVGRRLWGQMAAFRGKPGRGGQIGSGCDGCPSSGQSAPHSAKTNSSPLMQIQTKPPVHLRRPPADGR